jgi:hypothetical protein
VVGVQCVAFGRNGLAGDRLRDEIDRRRSVRTHWTDFGPKILFIIIGQANRLSKGDKV